MSRLTKAMLFVLLSLCLLSCEKHGFMQPDSPLETALSFTEEKLPLDSGEFIYRQSCNVESKNAGTLSFAYRLTTLKAEPLSGFSTDAEGWLVFAGQTIWTTDSQLSIDFTSQEGKIADLITGIQVKIKHADGYIEELASCFKSSRLFGSLIEVPFSDGAEVSAGLEFIMRETIGDIYVDGMYAHHFMHRLNILNEALEVIETGNWYSSIDSPDIRKVRLSLNTTPALSFNAPGTFTQFECYVVSRAGIEQEEPTSIYFRVQEGNQPVALLYPKTFVGLGEYHYGIVRNAYTYLLSLIPANGDKNNRELWAADTYLWDLEAIHSEDFKLHLRWGYSGQYGRETAWGVWEVTENPTHRELNQVLNPSGTNYHSRITAFWLRLDSTPFPAQAQFFEAELSTDSDGASWLRVANINDDSRHTILQNLDSGQHLIELRVEDLQGTLSEPVEISFNLAPYKAAQQRSGILVIDDSPNSYQNSPEAIVDAFYAAVTPSTWGNVNQLDLSDALSSKISPVKLQKYKAVLMHSDNPSLGMDIRNQVDALDIYLGNQGNLLWSNTKRLANQLPLIPLDFCTNRLGISDPEAVNAPHSPHNFFINAIGQEGLGDIPLNLSSPFSSIVSTSQGFSSLSLFDPSLNLDWLYAFGCKPVDYPVFPPTQAQYDLYSSKYVAYKYEANGSNVVIFGFPLSYMEEAPVANALNAILGDILGNSVAQRRNK